MSASKFHRQSTPSALTRSIAAIEFKAGDRVRIRSTHPLFPNWNCAIAALPSLDAAIVELESGVREYLRLSDLQLLCDRCLFRFGKTTAWRSSSVIVIKRNLLLPIDVQR